MKNLLSPNRLSVFLLPLLSLANTPVHGYSSNTHGSSLSTPNNPVNPWDPNKPGELTQEYIDLFYKHINDLTLDALETLFNLPSHRVDKDFIVSTLKKHPNILKVLAMTHGVQFDFSELSLRFRSLPEVLDKLGLRQNSFLPDPSHDNDIPNENFKIHIPEPWDKDKPWELNKAYVDTFYTLINKHSTKVLAILFDLPDKYANKEFILPILKKYPHILKSLVKPGINYRVSELAKEMKKLPEVKKALGIVDEYKHPFWQIHDKKVISQQTLSEDQLEYLLHNLEQTDKFDLEAVLDLPQYILRSEVLFPILRAHPEITSLATYTKLGFNLTSVARALRTLPEIQELLELQYPAIAYSTMTAWQEYTGVEQYGRIGPDADNSWNQGHVWNRMNPRDERIPKLFYEYLEQQSDEYLQHLFDLPKELANKKFIIDTLKKYTYSLSSLLVSQQGFYNANFSAGMLAKQFKKFPEVKDKLGDYVPMYEPIHKPKYAKGPYSWCVRIPYTDTCHDPKKPLDPKYLGVPKFLRNLDVNDHKVNRLIEQHVPKERKDELRDLIVKKEYLTNEKEWDKMFKILLETNINPYDYTEHNYLFSRGFFSYKDLWDQGYVNYDIWYKQYGKMLEEHERLNPHHNHSHLHSSEYESDYLWPGSNQKTVNTSLTAAGYGLAGSALLALGKVGMLNGARFGRKKKYMLGLLGLLLASGLSGGTYFLFNLLNII